MQIDVKGAPSGVAVAFRRRNKMVENPYDEFDPHIPATSDAHHSGSCLHLHLDEDGEIGVDALTGDTPPGDRVFPGFTSRRPVMG